METLGSAIDKLFTANLKTCHDGINGYAINLDKQLNLAAQRKSLAGEIDMLAAKVLKGSISEIDATRPQHKTY